VIPKRKEISRHLIRVLCLHPLSGCEAYLPEIALALECWRFRHSMREHVEQNDSPNYDDNDRSDAPDNVTAQSVCQAFGL
jgi:hypothetical protein